MTTEKRRMSEAAETGASGFEKNEIKLDVLGDMMTLSAEHCTESEEGENKENKEGKAPKYIRRERSCCLQSEFA